MKVFIELEDEVKCEGIWIGKIKEDLEDIDENIISKGEFEIDGEKFIYKKIFY